jgi:hypothetical protein
METNVHIESGDGATEELVTVLEQIEIEIDYPVTRKRIHHATRSGGFTLKAFVEAVLDGYKAIYADPDGHGVWGHGLGDLYLEGIEEHHSGFFNITVGS